MLVPGLSVGLALDLCRYKYAGTAAYVHAAPKKIMLNLMLDATVTSASSINIATGYVSTALRVNMCVPMSRPLQRPCMNIEGSYYPGFTERIRDMGGCSCHEPIRNGACLLGVIVISSTIILQPQAESPRSHACHLGAAFVLL